MPPLKIAFGIPAYRGRLASQHAAMWLSVGQYMAGLSASFPCSMITVDAAPVDRARNALVAHAMATGHEWLLMIDDDTWVEGDNPGRALFSMMHGAFRDVSPSPVAIVGAPVLRRGAKSLNVYRQLPDEETLAPVHLDAIESPKQFGNYIEVDAVGTAVMAINFKHINEAVFKFTDTHSEDLEFCRQIRAGGGLIVVDPSIRTAHLGNAPVMRY
jgi:GT2 family glycosyltransferase